MNSTILLDIKKLLGLSFEYDVFDMDIVIHINTALAALYQLGVGEAPVVVNGYDTKWSEVVKDSKDLEMIKTYIYLKVKNVFDPTASSVIAQAYDNTIKELEFRIEAMVDKGGES